MTAPYSKEVSLIDLALADQSDMSAVDRFSNYSDGVRPAVPIYRNLIPLTRPKSGEQYAFAVDMDRCSGCKACVSACHSLNGLEEGEMWRSVGTIIGEESNYLQTVTSSCHHCVDPACAAGCPVLAYEKDPVTGIVRHLDDQCIGCQYCVLKCPYDVPKYSKSKGIVRKCDMCHSRLAAGEAPACAQACPHEAIRIEIVSANEVRTANALPDTRMIPGAFPSWYTVPTTKYFSEKTVPARIRSACTDSLRLEEPHWPLIWMLVLTQMASGLHLLSATLRLAGIDAPYRAFSATAAVTLICGLTISVFHLGRPLKAWRVFLGWRRSWMSREILSFSVYAGCALLLLRFPDNPQLGILTAVGGLISVSCSAMIYVDTHRPGWAARHVFPSFFGTTFLLGTSITAAVSAWFTLGPVSPLSGIAMLGGVVFFAWRVANLARSKSRVFRLARGTFPSFVTLTLLAAAFWALAGESYLHRTPCWAALALLAGFAAQMMDRWLFFVGTPAPRMPGAFNP